MIDYQALMPILIRHKITPAQFLLMVLIQRKEYKLIYQYENPVHENGSWVTIAEVENLLERGYLRWMNPNAKERTYFPSEFEVTDAFLSEIYHENPMNAALEYWQCYPPKIRVQGQLLSGRSLGQVMDKERFLEWYAEAYGTDLHQHRTVMEGLRYAKKAGPLGMNILDYLTSGEYEADYLAAMEAEKKLPENLWDD